MYNVMEYPPRWWRWWVWINTRCWQDKLHPTEPPDIISRMDISVPDTFLTTTFVWTAFPKVSEQGDTHTSKRGINVKLCGHSQGVEMVFIKTKNPLKRVSLAKKHTMWEEGQFKTSHPWKIWILHLTPNKKYMFYIERVRIVRNSALYFSNILNFINLWDGPEWLKSNVSSMYVTNTLPELWVFESVCYRDNHLNKMSIRIHTK